MKTCNVCKQEKTLDSFHKDSSRASGYKSRCKVCVSADTAKWYKENKEQKAEYQKSYQSDWYQRNKSRAKEVKELWRKNHSDVVKVMRQNSRANRKAIIANRLLDRAIEILW